MTTGYVMRVLGTTAHGLFPADEPERFVVSWDVDAFDGFGHVEYGLFDEAHVFPTAGDALAAWGQQSSVLPIRPYDGQPNRPMTALTVEVVSVETVRAARAAQN